MGYVHGVTSNIQTQLNNKQATLVSGTNIKTINNQSVLGSGNLNVDGLPSQSGQSGKYLTTNGTTASWATVNVLPSQTGNAGKYLTTNGTTASWNSLATVATSGDYNDLLNAPTVSDEFDKTSSDAMSGIAVAEGILTIKQIDCGTMSTMRKQITLE